MFSDHKPEVSNGAGDQQEAAVWAMTSFGAFNPEWTRHSKCKTRQVQLVAKTMGLDRLAKMITVQGEVLEVEALNLLSNKWFSPKVVVSILQSVGLFVWLNSSAT